MNHYIIDSMAAALQQRVIGYIFLASVVDILLGLFKAFKSKNLNSTISSRGIFKHISFFIVPVLIYPITDLVTTGKAYWAVFTSLILITLILSCAENWIALGYPFPASLAKYLDEEKKKLK